MSRNHQKIKKLVRRNQKLFIDAISEFHAFTPQQIEKYSSMINFELLSVNQYANWDLDAVHKYKNKLDFGRFQASSKFWADTDMIDVFVGHLPRKVYEIPELLAFNTIESNLHVPWNEVLIQKYEHVLEFRLLSFNNSIEWTKRLLDRYCQVLNWTEISRSERIVFTEELIDRFHDFWNWGFLCINKAVPWNLKWFEKYRGNLDLSIVQLINNISGNFEIVEAYPELFNWRMICWNEKLPWVEKELIKRWRKRIDWFSLAGNEVLFRNDQSFFRNHLEKWFDNANTFSFQLSSNTALPWNNDLIDEFLGEWDWKRLAENSGLPWSAEFIERYLHFFCDYPAEGVLSKLESEGLKVSQDVPWTLDWVLRFDKHIQLDSLHNEVNWNRLFRPIMDEELLAVVFG